MAEATNQAPGEGQAPSPTAVTPREEHIATRPQLDLPAPPPEVETYRPLSLLALAGFGLAIVYALVVLVGGLVALVSRVPWILSLWSFTVPMVILIVCWAARTRIRNAEGTLSGMAFTTWGMRMTVVLALMYAMYYAFCFFAIRLQATAFVDRVFDQLKQGHMEQAFVMCLAIPANVEDPAELRDTIEMRFNSPSGKPGSVGAFSRFRQSQFVRYIAMSGEQTRITPLGVADWSYEKGGYHMVLRYHVNTPMVEFDLIVDAVGNDSKPGEPKGRHWGIDFTRGGLSVDKNSERLTPLGMELLGDKANAARTFVFNWTEKLNKKDWKDAYLDTLKPSERTGPTAAVLRDAAPVAGLAPLGLYDEAGREFLAGKQSLDKRNLIHINEKLFWASRSMKADIRRRMSKTFQLIAGKDQPNAYFRIPPQTLPIVSAENGRLTYAFDLEMRYMNEAAEAMDYVVEGALVVTADKDGAAQSPSAWWVERIDADSGRMPTMMRKELPNAQRGGMGQDMQP